MTELTTVFAITGTFLMAGFIALLVLGGYIIAGALKSYR
jgi:hypothetical protein